VKLYHPTSSYYIFVTAHNNDIPIPFAHTLLMHFVKDTVIVKQVFYIFQEKNVIQDFI